MLAIPLLPRCWIRYCWYLYLCYVLLQISAYERSPPHYYQHYIDELFPPKLVISCYYSTIPSCHTWAYHPLNYWEKIPNSLLKSINYLEHYKTLTCAIHVHREWNLLYRYPPHITNITRMSLILQTCNFYSQFKLTAPNSSPPLGFNTHSLDNFPNSLSRSVNYLDLYVENIKHTWRPKFVKQEAKVQCLNWAEFAFLLFSLPFYAIPFYLGWKSGWNVGRDEKISIELHE